MLTEVSILYVAFAKPTNPAFINLSQYCAYLHCQPLQVCIDGINQTTAPPLSIQR
jgi:hypothetical protein